MLLLSVDAGPLNILILLDLTVAFYIVNSFSTKHSSLLQINHLPHLSIKGCLKAQFSVLSSLSYTERITIVHCSADDMYCKCKFNHIPQLYVPPFIPAIEVCMQVCLLTLMVYNKSAQVVRNLDALLDSTFTWASQFISH